MLRSNVPRAVRHLRRHRGWRQTDLGARAGVSGPTVSRIERGNVRVLSVDAVERIASALGATVDVTRRWDGEQLDRLVDAAHSWLEERVAEDLTARLAGERRGELQPLRRPRPSGPSRVPSRGASCPRRGGEERHRRCPGDAWPARHQGPARPVTRRCGRLEWHSRRGSGTCARRFAVSAPSGRFARGALLAVRTPRPFCAGVDAAAIGPGAIRAPVVRRGARSSWGDCYEGSPRSNGQIRPVTVIRCKFGRFGSRFG